MIRNPFRLHNIVLKGLALLRGAPEGRDTKPKGYQRSVAQRLGVKVDTSIPLPKRKRTAPHGRMRLYKSFVSQAAAHR